MKWVAYFILGMGAWCVLGLIYDRFIGNHGESE